MNKLAIFFASGFYTGFVPRLPGTTGSAACLLLWLLLQLAGVSGLYAHAVLIALACLPGTVAAHISITTLRERPADIPFNWRPKQTKKAGEDPQFIVIDEWAGMLIALTGLAGHQFGLALLAFALFRLFDIMKPGPVGQAERLPGAWGVMLDDIVAGLLAALGIQLLLLLL